MARWEAIRNATKTHKKRLYRFGDSQACIELKAKTVEDALSMSPKQRIAVVEKPSKRKRPSVVSVQTTTKREPSEKAKIKRAKKEAARKAAIQDYKRRTAYEGPPRLPEVQGGLPGPKRSH